MNGMDLTNGSGTSQSNDEAMVDVKIDEVAPAPAFSVAQIAPRVPTAGAARVPLLDGRAVPASFREAWRELKLNLERAHERHGVRTVGIVSVGSGDGKSLVSANIALSLTEGGTRRVALLDAAFDAPRIADLFAAEAPTGLADVLAQKISPEHAMFAVGPAGLYALSAGSVSTADIDVLDVMDRFGMVTDRLATVFDYVLVDTPSLSARVDAAAIASRLDGVVLVVRARRTRASEIDRAVAKLGESRILGLVLNGA